MDPSVVRTLVVVAAAVLILRAFRKTLDERERRYLRAVPLNRLKYLLVAQSLFGASGAFFFDLVRGGTGDRVVVFLLAAAASVVIAVLFLVSARATRRDATIVQLVFVAIVAGTAKFGMGYSGAEPPSPARMTFDGAAILLSTVIGSLAYRLHITTEGSRQLKAEAELALAHRLQHVLVPAVIFRNTHLEIYGRAIPSEDVGGDLVDVVESDGGVLTYLVDVSGHGIPAGTLMGAVKAAVRSAASLPLGATLDTVNRVLPSVKEPAMYATLAAIRVGSSGTDVEYTLAGHQPILHLCAATGTVQELTLPQFALGFFDGVCYETRRVPRVSGDVFALFSDGIVESANARDEHFGVRRIAEQLMTAAGQSPEAVFAAVLSAAAKHGESHDDRSMLVIRML
jgi:serine phosphatase RsbU (regulator of sigma subunit)